jgi:4-amino-4-deoxy-L-arabinose transferase-like glycosyltransferase
MYFSKLINKIYEKWSQLDKTDKLLIILLIISFGIRIISFLYSSIRGWDETVYLNLGKDLSTNPFLYSLQNSNWSDYIPSSDLIYSWPNIGFRAPLLPYFLSLFNFIHLEFIIPVIIPLFATASVFLVYILGKELFNKKIGLYSAVIFSLVPIHIYCSGKIWADAFALFFILLTFVSFWKGYEKNNKKHKVLFGLFFGLSLLARYTTMWLAPVFPFYFLFRNESIKFLKDKYLWFTIGLFLIILIPWFIYGFVYYNNPLGSFIHGFKAANYYGGIQAWGYFFENSWRIFSVTEILFIFSLLFVFLKKEYLKKEVSLLLIWVIFFGAMTMIMPHKEDRYILIVVPAICLLSGLFISKIGRYKNIIFVFICLILLFSNWDAFKLGYEISKDKTNICFSEGNKFLAGNFIEGDSLVMTNQSPIVHYYTNKRIIFYPDVLKIDSIRNLIDSNYRDETVYILFTNFDMPKENDLKNELDNNFEKVFECSKTPGYSAVYKF